MFMVRTSSSSPPLSNYLKKKKKKKKTKKQKIKNKTKKKMKLKVDELNSKGSQHQVGNSKNFLELKIFNVKYEQKNYIV